jgi:hypothetical protein
MLGLRLRPCFDNPSAHHLQHDPQPSLRAGLNQLRRLGAHPLAQCKVFELAAGLVPQLLAQSAWWRWW